VFEPFCRKTPREGIVSDDVPPFDDDSGVGGVLKVQPNVVDDAISVLEAFVEHISVLTQTQAAMVPPNLFALAGPSNTSCPQGSTDDLRWKLDRCVAELPKRNAYRARMKCNHNRRVANAISLPAKVNANEGLCQKILIFRSDKASQAGCNDPRGRNQHQRRIASRQ
jgi:hypothetical protein